MIPWSSFVLGALLFVAPSTAQERAAAVPEKSAPAGEKRTLVFHRPETAGTKYYITVDGTSRYTSTLNLPGGGVKPMAERTTKASLEGTLEVLSVTPKNGVWSGVKVTVKRMNYTRDDLPAERLPEGSVITATAGKGGTVIELDGKTPPDEIAAALAVVLPPVTDYDEAVNNVYAPAGPVPPLAEWKPDLHKAQRILAVVFGNHLDPDKSTATVRYDGPETIAGEPGDTRTLKLHAVFTGQDGMLADRKFKSANCSFTSKCTMPQDVKTAVDLRSVIEQDWTSRFDMTTKEGDKDITARTLLRLLVSAKRLRAQ